MAMQALTGFCIGHSEWACQLKEKASKNHSKLVQKNRVVASGGLLIKEELLERSYLGAIGNIFSINKADENKSLRYLLVK